MPPDAGKGSPSSMGRYQWLLVALLSANFGVVFFDRNVFSYLTSFIQPDLKLSNFQIGNIASAFSFSWAIAGLCMGSLVDRFGRKPVIIVASLLGLVLPLGLLFSSGRQLMPLIACIAVGSALSGVFPLAMATIPSEIVGPARTATALSLTMGISEILGGVLAPSVAGKVADLDGLSSTLWILVGLVAVIIALAAMLRETAPAALMRRKPSAH
jgi:MFS transporter, ACS family, hexuronate transporter